MQVKKQQLKQNMEQQTGSKLGKEYIQAVYCHPGWLGSKTWTYKYFWRQQYMNCELPDVQAGFRKGRGTRDQIANIRCIIKKAREFQKNIYFCFIDYTKALDSVDHHKL